VPLQGYRASTWHHVVYKPCPPFDWCIHRFMIALKCRNFDSTRDCFVQFCCGLVGGHLAACCYFFSSVGCIVLCRMGWSMVPPLGPGCGPRFLGRETSAPGVSRQSQRITCSPSLVLMGTYVLPSHHPVQWWGVSVWFQPGICISPHCTSAIQLRSSCCRDLN